MDLFLYAVTFVISWSIALFLVLPIGVVSPGSMGRFDDAGAPAKARMPMKFLLAALIAAAVTAIFALIVQMHWVSFR